MKQSTSDFFVVANNTNIFLDNRIGNFLTKEFQEKFSFEVPYIKEPTREEYFEQKFDLKIGFSSSGFNRFCFKEFQNEVIKKIGKDKAKSILWIESETFTGVFLPLDIEPTRIDLPNFKRAIKRRIFSLLGKFIFRNKPFPKKIDCASLFELKRELELFARTAGLPTENKALEELDSECWRTFWKLKNKTSSWVSGKYTFSQMMLAVNEAIKHNYPLWCK